jgi:threonine/homoserine/homoserine lactone efflux protein
MVERLPALIFGLLLVIGGAVMLWMHLRTWRSRRDDSSLSGEDRQYYRRQFRRRIQVSGLVIVIGILLPIMDVEDFGKNYPGWWTACIMLVLGLSLWIMFLAWGDLVSTRTYSRAALSRLREQQRELEQEAARLKSQAANRRSEA